MIETLLGYLLGALDADDVEQLSSLLETDLELQRQLDLLRLALEPLELCRRESIDAPADLAVRTWVVIREVLTSDRSA